MNSFKADLSDVAGLVASAIVGDIFQDASRFSTWQKATGLLAVLSLLASIVGLTRSIRLRGTPRPFVSFELKKLNDRQLWTSFLALAVANSGLVVGTAGFTSFYRSHGANWDAAPPIKYALVQFDLSRENVAASWYSAMLLLLVALAALTCCCLDYRVAAGRTRLLSFGWLIISLMFATLSLDEMGSVHERIGQSATLNPGGDMPMGWVKLLAVPIGVAAVFMLLFGWIRLRHHLHVFGLLALGVALFVSVPFHERFETGLLDAAPSRSDFQRPVWQMVLEEGTEIFGSLSFLLATVLYCRTTMGKIRQLELQPRLAIPHLWTLAFGLTSVFASGVVLSDLFVEEFRGGDDGITTLWFPSATALITSLVCLFLGQVSFPGKQHSRRSYHLTSGIFVILSAYFGANLPAWNSSISQTYRRGSDLVTIVEWFLSLLVVLIGLYWFMRVSSYLPRVLTLLSSFLTIWAIQDSGKAGSELPFWALMTWLVLFLLHLALRQQPAPESCSAKNTDQVDQLSVS